MARPKEFDEKDALDKAVEIFWEKGYEATSISDLERKMGLGRQSIYNTFGDKHQVFLRALDNYAERGVEAIRETLMRDDSGLDSLRAYFDLTVARLTPKGPRRACLMANTALELGGRDKKAGAACVRNQDNIIDGFRHALTNAIERGEISRETEVDATAGMLMAQVYGMTVMAKAGASAEQLRKIADSLLDKLV